MQLKRFRGKELPEVVRQIRQELGPDAVILHARPSRVRGALGLMATEGVEVLAALDPSPIVPPVGTASPAPTMAGSVRPGPSPAPAAAMSLPGPIAAGPRTVRPADAPVRPTPPVMPRLDPWRRSTPERAGSIESQLAELRDLVVRLGAARTLPPEQVPLYERMTTAGVEESLALAVLTSLPRTDREGHVLDSADLALALEDRLTSMVPVAPPRVTDGNPVVVFVGPAGAGKSTSLAKLASRARIASASLHLVSLDDGGLGAPSPLETFAGILQVPYTFVPTPADLGPILARIPEETTVMIDAPGLDPGDAAGLQGLGELLQAAAPTEVHLVLPATMKTGDALATVRAFAGLGVTDLLWTRLDATATHGTVLTATLESELPLSYFGTGRDVPDDIRPATPRQLAHLVLGREA